MRSTVRWLPAGIAVLAFPRLPGVGSSTLGAANLGAAYALVAIALVLLTGWVGQISLAHAAFVGIGSYATGWVAAGIGIPFPLSLPFAVVTAAAGAAVLGVVALRVRGLFLAVATLIFSWMASEFLFRQEWLTRHYLIPDRLIGEGTLPSFDFTSRRTFFYVAWALVIAGVIGATNIRDSKTGRAFFAVRGSEMATAALGIDVIRYKLLAFALSGGLAGAAGNVIMSNSRAVTPDQFTFTASLFFLSIAVVGGLRSLGGAITSAILFASLSEVFFRIPSLGGYLELVSAALLAMTLLVYPKGLAGLGQVLGSVWLTLRRRPQNEGSHVDVLKWFTERFTRLRLPIDRLSPQLASLPATFFRTLRLLRRRRADFQPEPLLDWDLGSASANSGLNGSTPSHPAHGVTAGPASGSKNGHGDSPGRAASVSIQPVMAVASTVGPASREEHRVLVEADAVTVRFGGLTAVSKASLQVREGEITGLIGPNGAGKTTMFNSIAGFVVPTSGTIRMFGRDVTDLAVHQRARLGVARTFQTIQLFPQLSVFDNLLVATHLQNQTGVWSHLVVTAEALRYEKLARHRVRQALKFLELDHIADRRVVDLPFGMLRMVEMARAMVTGFRLMMLDEPASGLDNAETDHLIDVIRFVRSLGVSVLLIEHDVRMVTAVSDYLYVLDQGRIIAEGAADDVQQNPAVIAAYLGEPVREAVH